jgi:hypothetical protein
VDPRWRPAKERHHNGLLQRLGQAVSFAQPVLLGTSDSFSGGNQLAAD